MKPFGREIGIDDGVRARNKMVLVVTAAIYLLAVVISAVLGWARVSYTGRLGERLNETLRIQVFGHIQRQGVDFHTEEKAGVVHAQGET